VGGGGTGSCGLDVCSSSYTCFCDMNDCGDEIDEVE
jgi:hypothetical protein